eukprot:scaffold2478_cov270-Pinguiococcus_pyrenoidosus.AAC.6
MSLNRDALLNLAPHLDRPASLSINLRFYRASVSHISRVKLSAATRLASSQRLRRSSSSGPRLKCWISPVTSESTALGSDVPKPKPGATPASMSQGHRVWSSMMSNTMTDISQWRKSSWRRAAWKAATTNNRMRDQETSQPFSWMAFAALTSLWSSTTWPPCRAFVKSCSSPWVRASYRLAVTLTTVGRS